MKLDGKVVAEKIYAKLTPEIKELKERKTQPFLTTILIGEDPASLSFIKIKEKAATNLGVEFRIYHLPGIVSEESILDLIAKLNKNKFVHGIILQLPLPEGLDTDKIIKTIDPKKDIDGLLGSYMPPTAAAILEILKFYKFDYKGKKIILVGHGTLVGGPLEKMLMAQGVEPLVCDSKTTDLKGKLLTGDIIISATGVPGLIIPEMVNEDAIIIDAGVAECGGKIKGDVDPRVYEKVKAYSPVPGGVGPVTVVCLMRNLVEAARS